jgi:DNA-nicking Smr family endonuclease
MTFKQKNKSGKAKNASLKSIDLHGYKSDEVFDALDQFLLKASRTGQARVKIITGKGKGIVQKETEKYLKLAGYHFQKEKMDNGKINDGVLIVFVE